MILTRENYKDKKAYENEKFTFGNYLVDESNFFAHEIAQEMASIGWKERNSFIIYGKLGMGKKHLAYALLKELLEHKDAGKVCCVEGYDCERVELLPEVCESDAMVILNAHIILKQGERIAENFLAALAHCWQHRKIVIMTMDCHPEELTAFKDDFCRVVNIAKIAEIGSPNHEFCKRMINYWIKADNLDKFKINEEVIDYIAKVGAENFRILQGTLNKVIAVALLEKKAINLEFAKEVLAKLDPNSDLNKKTVIHMNWKLEDLVNNDELPITVYLNMENLTVEIFEEDEEPGKNHLKLPAIDELAPYKSVIYDFVSEIDIPVAKSASKFLKENGLYMEFLNYRKAYAVNALKEWLSNRKVVIIEDKA